MRLSPRIWGMAATWACACGGAGGEQAVGSSTSGANTSTLTSVGTAASAVTGSETTNSGNSTSTATSSDVTTSASEGTATTRSANPPVGALTVTLATQSADEALVNATPLQLCLRDDTCFPLSRAIRVADGRREAGPLQFEVTAHDDAGLSVEDVDRFELRAGSEAAFVPHCLSVSFDGSPALCTKDFSDALGTSASFEPGTASDCVSCFEREDDTDLMLTHGPFVGARDADAGSANIWLRTDASRPVEVYVSPSPDMAGARLAASATPSARDDFTVELVVDTLATGGLYFYQVSVDGQVHAPQSGDAWHPAGTYRLQMPPATGASGQLTFALSSCARMFKHGNFDALRDSQPAFWLNVGDYHYGNVLQTHFTNADGTLQERASPEEHRAARDDLRWWYRTAYWERSTVLATVPSLNTWDDHDFGGNTEEAHGEHIAKQDTRTAFVEYMANGDHDRMDSDEAVYFRSTYGDVDLFVLDPRYHRPALVPNEDGDLVAPDPSADPLGEQQTEWLLEGLASSEATFKFIAAGTRFYGGSNKAWLPFLVARDALLTRIVDAGVGGVVFLAGGPHASEYRQFTAAGRTWHELGASPITSGLSGAACSGASGQIACYDEIKNFLLLDIDTTLPDPTVTARVMTFDGEQPWSPTQATIVLNRSMLE